MNVISCSRCVTTDGYSKIEAVVEISKDKRMTNVNESIRLTFNFQRNKDKDSENVSMQSDDSDNDQATGKPLNNAPERNNRTPTRITYDVDYSKDHGEKKRLITVEVHAQNNHPSVEEAVPMDAEGDESDEEGNKIEVTKESESPGDMSVSMMAEDNSASDKYAAYVDPENLQDFLAATGLQFDAENLLFFLMTFPFYEQEWDIFGFLLDCVFGGGDEDSNADEGMSGSDDEDM